MLIRWLGRVVHALRDMRGGTAIEYGLILSLMVLVMLSALSDFAKSSVKMWTNVADQVNKAG
ncbi:Flp family type IVb pilin [Aquisediminimonas sediminicola]|uniref:Flp family type IVb pilin n=1 Tax=Alteraquisediminimonas sediminicola TaxID=2676787 RepID=UPI001C8ED1DB|nr:Flp family type IVb pilin [Aquisediminimonas sediminicola]